MTTWTEALDRYEAGLAHHEALLATGEPAPGPPPWPPARLPAGPFPAELRARAEDLLARSTELARRLTAARDSLPPLPASTPRGGYRSSTPTATRLDQSI